MFEKWGGPDRRAVPFAVAGGRTHFARWLLAVISLTL